MRLFIFIIDLFDFNSNLSRKLIREYPEYRNKIPTAIQYLTYIGINKHSRKSIMKSILPSMTYSKNMISVIDKHLTKYPEIYDTTRND